MKKLALIFATISILCTTVLTSCMDLFDDGETALYGTITFDPNGGTLSDPSYKQTFKKGEEFILKAPSVTHTDVRKQCIGWAKLSTASSYDYTNGNKMSSFYDLTLFAVWNDVDIGFYISSSGLPGNTGGENDPLDSIQTAISKITERVTVEIAKELDWIFIIDGQVSTVASDKLDNSLKAKSLTIKGRTGTTSDSLTTNSGTVLTIDMQNANTTVHLKNITVTGGNATNGGGIYIKDSNVIFEEGTYISGNNATNGAGVYIQSGTLTMKSGSKIISNVATYLGGGVYTEGTLNLNSGCEISGNNAGVGGGVYNHTNVDIVDNYNCVKNNTSGGDIVKN